MREELSCSIRDLKVVMLRMLDFWQDKEAFVVTMHALIDGYFEDRQPSAAEIEAAFTELEAEGLVTRGENYYANKLTPIWRKVAA